jgi:hypothetical protein
MAASTSVTFWAFVWYVSNNPYKTNMTRQDIQAAARLFAAANSTEITDATDPGGTYTDIEWPDASGGASSITAIGNSSTDKSGNVRFDLIDQASKATLDQAQFPEKHRGA